MDPIGLALESYNARAMARPRPGQADRYSRPIDHRRKVCRCPPNRVGSLPKSDAVIFIAACLEKMLTYAIGRGMEYYERADDRRTGRFARSRRRQIADAGPRNRAPARRSRAPRRWSTRRSVERRSVPSRCRPVRRRCLSNNPLTKPCLEAPRDAPRSPSCSSEVFAVPGWAFALALPAFDRAVPAPRARGRHRRVRHPLRGPAAADGLLLIPTASTSPLGFQAATAPATELSPHAAAAQRVSQGLPGHYGPGTTQTAFGQRRGGRPCPRNSTILTGAEPKNGRGRIGLGVPVDQPAAQHVAEATRFPRWNIVRRRPQVRRLRFRYSWLPIRYSTGARQPRPWRRNRIRGGLRAVIRQRLRP